MDNIHLYIYWIYYNYNNILHGVDEKCQVRIRNFSGYVTGKLLKTNRFTLRTT